MRILLLIIISMTCWGFIIRGTANFLISNEPSAEHLIDSFPIADIKNSTFQIASYSEYIATAFFVKSTDAGSYAVTNRHFCVKSEVKGAAKEHYYSLLSYYPVFASLEGRNIRGFITTIDPNADLCLIHFPTLKNVPTISKFATVPPNYTEKSLTYGFPGSLAGKSAFYQGVMGSTSVTADYFYQTFYMHVEHGQSGSPIINQLGQLVGVVHLKFNNFVNTGGAVPITVVNRFLCREIQTACEESL